MKKFIAILMSLLMIAGFLPTEAFASETSPSPEVYIMNSSGTMVGLAEGQCLAANDATSASDYNSESNNSYVARYKDDTLYLNGYSIDATTADTNNSVYAIAGDDYTIVVEADSSITLKRTTGSENTGGIYAQSLTINGLGTLKLNIESDTANAYGIRELGSLAVAAPVEINAKAPVGSWATGIYVHGGTIALSSGKKVIKATAASNDNYSGNAYGIQNYTASHYANDENNGKISIACDLEMQTGDGVISNGIMTDGNIEINGANVTISSSKMATGIKTKGNITISDNSNVNVNLTNKYGNGIYAGKENWSTGTALFEGTGTLTITDSTVNVSSGSYSVKAKNLSIKNSDAVFTTTTQYESAVLTETAVANNIDLSNKGSIVLESYNNAEVNGEVGYKAGLINNAVLTSETYVNKGTAQNVASVDNAIRIIGAAASSGKKGRVAVIGHRNATVSDETISGTRYATLKNATVNVSLAGYKFGESVSGNWITNLPSGLTQSVTKKNDTNATITISGTPRETSSDVLKITIPAANIVGWTKDVVVNENTATKFAIIANASSSSDTKTDSVTNDKDTTGSNTNKVATTTATVKAETKTETDGTKTTTATVDTDTAAKIIENAVENNSEEVVVNTSTANAVTETAAGTKTEVSLPAETITQVAEKTAAAVTIKSDAAEVKLDKDAVKAVAEAAGTDGEVKLEVQTVAQDEHKVEVDLKLVTSQGNVQDFKGGSVSVTVKLNDSLAAKPVVCVYIDDFGTYHKVEGAKNTDGTFTFETGHFSTYAIMAESEADQVIAEQTRNVKDMVSALSLKARSKKTKNGNIRVTTKVDQDKIKAIADLGYTVTYKFFCSTKKAAGYKAAIEQTGKSYVDKTGRSGKTYYYKARVMVYDAQGNLITKTTMKQCTYTNKTR